MLKIASIAVAGLTAMGGWAVVTVKDLPEYFVAGQRYTIEFQVRQHGHNLLSDLRPELIVAGSGGSRETTIPAVRRPGEGTYAATFTAPAAGQVTLTILSGFGASNLRLYPAPVIAAGATPSAVSAVDRGRMLFVAKGCNACHANTDLVDRPDNQQIRVGPELGGGRLTRDYVLKKVKSPASQVMPDLGLSEAEANALAAFISGGRSAATGGRGGR